MAYYQIEFFISSAKVLCRLACYGLVIQRMEEGLSLKAFQSEAGVSCKRLHFIYAYRVNKECRDAHRVSQLFGDICSEVGSMLAVRRVFYVVYDCVIHLVCTRWNVLKESASPADSIKVLKFISIFTDGFKDSIFSEWCLIYHMRILCDLRSFVVNTHAHHFFFVLKYADFGRSRTRVDYKNFHFWILLSVSFISCSMLSRPFPFFA